MPTAAERNAMIEKIRRLPAQLEAVVKDLSEADLTTPYLQGEWTVAQNVHHLVDSHVNAYIRLKLILTEEKPPLKGYNQEVWAELPDATPADLSTSLAILRGLHARWTMMLESLTEDQWNRVGIHSEYGETSLNDQLKTYAGHGEGHIDQIQRTLAAKG